MPRKFSYLPTAEDFFIHIAHHTNPSAIIGVPPARVNKEYLDNFFKCDIAYLKDEAKDVFWPHQWATDLKPKPYKYFIYDRDPHLKLIDADADYDYVGEAAFCAVNVPGTIAKDELMLWIRTGLTACDPQVEDVTKRLQAAQTKLLKVMSDRTYFLENHNYMAKQGEELDDDAVPDIIRNKPQFQRVIERRQKWTRRVANLKANLQQASLTIKTMPIILTRLWAQGLERDPNEDPFRARNKTQLEVVEEMENKEMDRVYTWKIDIHNDDARQFRENAVSFNDWGRVLLLPRRRKNKRTVCRYVPPGAELVQDDEKEGRLMEMLLDRSVNMKEVYLIALRHGNGSCRTALNTICSGTFRGGFRHGYGIEMGLAGRYTGTFDRGIRQGRGTLELPNGDVWTGDMDTGTTGEFPERRDPRVKHWGRSLAAEPRTTKELRDTMEEIARLREEARPIRELGPLAGLPERVPYWQRPPLWTIRSQADFEHNPYAKGLPHGDGVVKFADGSTYEGEMHNGRPHGFGLYKGIDGEIKKGMFRNGVLHGLGTHTWKDGRTRTGLFQYGEITRRGFERCPDGEEYEGDFNMDVRHGQGCSRNRKGGYWKYDGGWKYGTKQGVGEAIRKDERRVGFRVFARWTADSMRPRSSFTRMRPKSMQGFRVDAAHPPMDYCTHLGVTADSKVADELIGRIKKRGDQEREMKYLIEKSTKRVRKRLGIGSRMQHKRWVRMRRIWQRFAHAWKELVLDKELAAAEMAIARRHAAEVQESVARGSRERQAQIRARRAGAGAGAGAGAPASALGTDSVLTTTVGGDESTIV